jgi:hypothetical protein
MDKPKDDIERQSKIDLLELITYRLDEKPLNEVLKLALSLVRYKPANAKPKLTPLPNQQTLPAK